TSSVHFNNLESGNCHKEWDSVELMQNPRRSAIRRAAGTVLAAAFALATLSVHAEGAVLLLSLPDRIRLSERTNRSRTEDGRYVGLMNRQVTGYLTRAPGTEALFTGRMLVYEQTLRDMSRVGRPVDESYSATLTVDPRRAFTDSNRVPRYRSIPALPEGPVFVGDTWSAPGELVIVLPHGTEPIVLEVHVNYRYAGLEPFDGELVHRIEGQFGTRYPPLPDPEDDGTEKTPLRTDINRIAGRHSLTILLPADSAAPFFVRDEIEEQYELMNAPTTLVRGHTLLFVRGLSVRAQQEIAEVIEHRFQEAETQGVVVEQTDTGTRVTVQDIRFVPDQAVILLGERDRLEQIAEVLKSIPDVRFLVVGHTADVGTEESQLELSQQRAEVIVAELVRRGLDPMRFDIEGRGGDEPVASNENEAGRALNRRVEIYILEE
ncbi:MAG: OmpA family protein, partial [Spirochaetaceae bacterium]|nr:OmpA family protein [Spirochaetaceae bacterium]